MRVVFNLLNMEGDTCHDYSCVPVCGDEVWIGVRDFPNEDDIREIELGWIDDNRLSCKVGSYRIFDIQSGIVYVFIEINY